MRERERKALSFLTHSENFLEKEVVGDAEVRKSERHVDADTDADESRACLWRPMVQLSWASSDSLCDAAILLAARDKVKNARQNEYSGAFSEAGNYPENERQVVNEDCAQSDDHEVSEADHIVQPGWQLVFRLDLTLHTLTDEAHAEIHLAHHRFLFLFCHSLWHLKVVIILPKRPSSILPSVVIIIDRSCQCRFRLFGHIASLMDYGHQRDFPRKEHKGNVAEEDQQENASEENAWNALLALDVLKDGRRDVFLSEVGNRDGGKVSVARESEDEPGCDRAHEPWPFFALHGGVDREERDHEPL